MLLPKPEREKHMAKKTSLAPLSKEAAKEQREKVAALKKSPRANSSANGRAKKE